jgi:hypothetical protein
MTAGYQVQREADYLFVLVARRPVDERLAQDFFEAVPRQAREAGLSKVLIDMREVQGELSVTDRYELAKGFAEGFRGLRVALVQAPPLLDPQRFGLTVAANRGATAEVFTTLAAARAWLAADDPGRLSAGGEQTHSGLV